MPCGLLKLNSCGLGGGLAVLGGLTPPEDLFLDGDDERALGQSQRLLDGFRKARPHLRIVLEPVDDNFNVVLDATIELEVIGQADDLAIDASADEAALEHVLEKV